MKGAELENLLNLLLNLRFFSFVTNVKGRS